MSKRSMTDYGLLLLKGASMGIANKIPGVSGGIVAIVTGFYSELLFSFKRLNLKAVSLLLTGRLKSFWQYINGAFLFALLLGVIISYFTVSLILDLALSTYPEYVWSLFFGLVLASGMLLYRDYNAWNKQTVLFACFGLAAGIGLSLLPPLEQNTHVIYVFFCGVISIVGMTLPGLSGSFLLILLGNYSLLLVDAVNSFGKWVVLPLYPATAFSSEDQQHAILFGIFLFGSVVGISVLSNLIHQIQQRAKNELQATIIGFIFGSLFILWPTRQASNSDIAMVGYPLFWTIFWGIIGLILVFILDYYERKKQS